MKILLKFISNGQINNIIAFVQIMTWRPPGDRPASELMLVILLTHICVTRQYKNNILKRKVQRDSLEYIH